jgi:hypothetical protein
LFQKVLKEEVSLRDGERVKKISKAEAVIRSVVVGALKGLWPPQRLRTAA